MSFELIVFEDEADQRMYTSIHYEALGLKYRFAQEDFNLVDFVVNPEKFVNPNSLFLFDIRLENFSQKDKIDLESLIEFMGTDSCNSENICCENIGKRFLCHFYRYLDGRGINVKNKSILMTNYVSKGDKVILSKLGEVRYSSKEELFTKGDLSRIVSGNLPGHIFNSRI